MFIRISVLIAVLVAMALSVSSLSRSKEIQQTKPEQSSEEERGIKLRASVIKERFRVGEPILLKLVLKNDSTEEARLVSTGLRDYKLDVRNELGELRPLTVAGEALKRTESISISKGRIALKPGKEREEGDISVTDRFKLTEPGRYMIIVRRPGLHTGGKRGNIESNKVTVTIE